MTPHDHAAAILAWLGDRSLADVQDPPPALATHADALADAADSDDETVRQAGLAALFGGLVEPLNDGFTPAGRFLYHRLFGRVCWRVCARVPALHGRLARHGIANEADLLARHARLRAGTDPLPALEPRRIAVLSRVTLGADVLLTTVVLQRLHARWPAAELVVLGDAKLGGLVGGLPQVRVRPLAYARRGPLRERLASWLVLDDAIANESPDLVVAPDSRLDQLGLLPLGSDPARYRLWENLRPAGAAPESLATQVDRWCAHLLGLPATPACLPRLGFDAERVALAARLRAALGRQPLCAVKLDHGGNPAKALPRAGELHLLRGLRARGWRILLDRGFGAAELANSDELLAALGVTCLDLDDSGQGLGRAVAHLAPGELATAEVVRFHGSIGGWAAALASCTAALSYDSVGHHLAAALGVPLGVAFTGYADPGFPVAWQPRGAGQVHLCCIPTAEKDQPRHWDAVLALPAFEETPF